jgi:hypothetical protein
MPHFCFGEPSINWEHGYRILRLPVMFQREEEAFPTYGNSSWEKHDLPKALANMNCSDLFFTAQYSADLAKDSGGWHAWRAEFRDLRHVDYNKAFFAFKTLERIQRFVRIEREAGYHERNNAFWGLAKALKMRAASGWARPVNAQARSVNETAWTRSSLTALVQQLEDMTMGVEA